MEKSKIEKFLGISYDKWLKLPQISIIHLDQDANIYINENCLFYFNSTDNTLNLAQNYRYINIDTSNLGSDINTFPITSRFSLDRVTGFISTVESGPYGTYINRRF